MTERVLTIVDPPPLAAGNDFESTTGYELLELLGAGGMGEVWLAERVSAAGHTQNVAVKFLSGEASEGALADEARRMSRLSHDNIVPFVDSGRDAAGRLFVALAYIEGCDLDDFRQLVGNPSEDVFADKAEARPPEPIVGFIIFMVLRALHHAHTLDFGDGVVGMIHRDVSPGNILIDEARGFIKLSDFGIAISGGAEGGCCAAGKVPYMAPEVITEKSVDARSDLYSLGLVAYELLTGFNPNVHPRTMNSVIGTITNVMLSYERPLRAPHEVVRDIDPGLSRIVMKLLAREPVDRYPTAESVVADLSPYLYDHGVGPTTASLASYMKMLRDPHIEPTGRIRRSLQFLKSKYGKLVVRAPYELTPEAAADLAAGHNPARLQTV